METDMFVQGDVRHRPQVCALIVSLMISDQPLPRSHTSNDKIYDFSRINHSGHFYSMECEIANTPLSPGHGVSISAVSSPSCETEGFGLLGCFCVSTSEMYNWEIIGVT